MGAIRKMVASLVWAIGCSLLVAQVHMHSSHWHWKMCKRNLFYHFMMHDSTMCRSLLAVVQWTEVLAAHQIRGLFEGGAAAAAAATTAGVR